MKEITVTNGLKIIRLKEDGIFIYFDSDNSKGVLYLDKGDKEPWKRSAFQWASKQLDEIKESDMKLEVLRFSSQNESTIGLLFDVTGSGRQFLCFTLEDEFRTVKKYGETRIPAGTYKLGLKKHGGFHNRYMKKFGFPFHKGMIQILDVPKFKDVLMHIGNRDDDTDACLLVGDQAYQNITDDGFIGSSTTAYKRIYPDISRRLLNGADVCITYVNYEKHTT